ncbi:MAG: outer membrane protein [Arenicella sp.]|jgi:outer membrane protein
MTSNIRNYLAALPKKILLVACLSMCFCFNPVVAKSRYEIGILLDLNNEEFTPILDQLASEIVAVVGNDASINISVDNIKVNNFDIDLARKHYNEMLKSNTDIILAFGPINNELLVQQKKHSKPTILFGAANTDVIDIDASKQVSGINNFTYILASLSYNKDLDDFRNIFPFKRIGVVGGLGPWNTEASRSTLDNIFAEMNVQYELIQYGSPALFATQLDNVDSVYLAEGFGLRRAEIKQLADILLAKKLPSFSSWQVADVKDGWLATNQSDSNFERLFRRIALSVEAVVNGENLSNRPVYVDFSDTVTINYNTAEKIGVPLRYSQLATTDIIGSYEDFVVDKSYSVLEAVDVALQNNLNLQSSAIEVDLARQGLASSKASYYPDLSLNGSGRYVDPDLASLSGGQNPEQTISGSITLSQTLYSEDGSAAISIQRSLLEAQQENYNVAALDTVLTTSQTSFNLLRLKNSLQSQAENLEITKRNLAIANQNFEAGQSSKADIFRFQSEMATNSQSLIDALNEYQQGQYALNIILNLPIDTRIAIQDVALKNSPFEPEGFGYQRLSETLDDPAESKLLESYLVKQAFRIAPELAALNHNLDSIERDMAQYGWRRYIPTVSATAQYNNIFDRSGVGVPDPNLALDSDYNVGLVFSIPLFNRNTDNVKLRIARKRYEQARLQIASQRQSIEKRVRDALLDLTGKIANIELSKVAETAAEQGLKLIEASYANGAVTITELIDSQNNYLQAQLGSSNALYNFLDSAVSMERAIGKYIFRDRSSVENENFIRGYKEYRDQLLSDKAGTNNE